MHALSWPFGVISPGLEDAEAVRHLSFDEVEAIYRASITAVFDEIHPRPDWLIQFARGDADPLGPTVPRRCLSSERRNM